jgi:DNA transformation protein
MASREFQRFILDLLTPIGGVALRRMFGGAGLFSGPAMFGIIMNDMIYFKVDDVSRQSYLAEGAKPFAYSTRRGARGLSSFFEVPGALLDEPDDFRIWALRAVAAAQHLRRLGLKNARKEQ